MLLSQVMTSKYTICLLTFIQVNMRFQQNNKEIINMLYDYLIIIEILIRVYYKQGLKKT
jgi:hypothetical protein